MHLWSIAPLTNSWFLCGIFPELQFTTKRELPVNNGRIPNAP